MRSVSLFSGAGGMDIGFDLAGFEVALACEIDKDAAATFASNFKGRMHHGDVRGLVPTLEPGMASALFGGPPCQGYSVAGKMDPSDPRSMHVHSFLEAVERVRPAVFVMENVDSLAKLPRWRGAFADVVAKAEALGYAVHCRVLNAHDYGVPQTRKRMFLFGVRGGQREDVAAAVDASLAGSERKGGTMRGVMEVLGPADSQANPMTCTAIITYAKKPVLRPSPYAGMMFNGAGRPIRLNKPAPTIAASTGGNKTHFVDEAEMFEGQPSYIEGYHERLYGRREPPLVGTAPARLRRLTVAECLAIQTFPNGYRLSGRKSSHYRQIGNAVPPRLAEAVGRAAMAAAKGAQGFALAA